MRRRRRQEIADKIKGRRRLGAEGGAGERPSGPRRRWKRRNRSGRTSRPRWIRLKKGAGDVADAALKSFRLGLRHVVLEDRRAGASTLLSAASATSPAPFFT